MEFTLSQNDFLILKKLLLIEHENVANKLGLINRPPTQIDDEELPDIIGLIDNLSRDKDEKAQKLTTLLCALLWNYRSSKWNGLRDFFLVILSRIGLSPTAIMVDDEYDHESKMHFRLNSLFSEMSVALNKMQYEVTVGEEQFSLTKFQKNVWDTIEENKVVGISAPTSAGKSFVLLLKSIEILMMHKGTLVYIVPNLSLVSQVSTDFRQLLNRFSLNHYRIMNTYTERVEETSIIYVLTQERAIGAFSVKENPFNNLMLLIVDEIQNIERTNSENEERSKILFDTLTEFRINSKPERIIISGPRINNIEDLAVDLFGEEAEQQETLQSPVVNLTYSIFQNKQGFFLRQYSDVMTEPVSMPFYNTNLVKGIGQKVYTEPFHNYLKFILNGLGRESINIIFSPNSSQARKTALAIRDQYPIVQGNKELSDLIRFIEYTVHPDYDLVESLKRGVAYHHGKLPHHVRRVIEKAINDRIINNIVCTTTLMQGVNLPAQNVIIRNPNLFIRKRSDESPKLSNYEFANLRGRAGRLLKDFIGRTYILDEAAFENDEVEQEVLFGDTQKELKVGYSERFSENKHALFRCLVDNKVPDKDTKHAYFLPYIRNTILKYGENAKKNLETVGIILPDNIFNAVRMNLTSLTIPLEVCLKNRYWDPIVLESLYKKRNRFDLPNSPFDVEIVNRLMSVISIMKNEYYYYFEKFLNIDKDALIFYMCVDAEKWLKENTLIAILNTPYNSDSEAIEKTINTLQNTISYKLPALLKPLYDIIHPESNFLSYIEMGAFKSRTRRLIEMGVPRETAIILCNVYLQDINDNDENIETKLIRRLKEVASNLPYWIKVQLESIL